MLSERGVPFVGGSGRMRRSLLLVCTTTALLGVTVVTLASASPNVTTPSFLPKGVTAAGANWFTNGDTSNSRYSTLSQINLNTVKNLKVVWNQQFNTTDTQFSPEGQPT